MSARTIAFGSSDMGVATLIIRRASNDDYWNEATKLWQVGSYSNTLTYDTVLQQYYSETTPTQRCYWTAFDSIPMALSFGEYGSGFPSAVDPGSASVYTMAEVIARIRVQIRDSDSVLYTDNELLNILDECNEWIMNQCQLKQATLGVKQAVYTGDGTTEWAYPGDFLGLHYFSNPALNQDYGLLVEFAKAAYDAGKVASRIAGTRGYSKVGNLLYFLSDLATSGVINCYYYPRVVKLTAATTVPYDGKFMSLMVKWGVMQAFASDEYSVTFESSMFGMFMEIAKDYLRRDIVPSRVQVGNTSGLRNKNLGSIRNRQGRSG